MKYKETIDETPNEGSDVAFILRWGDHREIYGTYVAGNDFKTNNKIYEGSFDVVRWRYVNVQTSFRL